MLKWVFVLCGTALLFAAVGFLFLVVEFPGRSTDHLIMRSVSPDGKLAAELHEIVTPMHGGPDMLQVTLHANESNTVDIVYSRIFECGPDYSGYQLHWKSTRSLTITYGVCDDGRYTSGNDNSESQKLTIWRDVNIRYERSEHIARAER